MKITIEALPSGGEEEIIIRADQLDERIIALIQALKSPGADSVRRGLRAAPIPLRGGLRAVRVTVRSDSQAVQIPDRADLWAVRIRAG